MIKIKMYKADNPLSYNEILEKLNENLYSDDKGYGFHILSNGEILEIKFTMRTISKQNIEYASGEHTEIEVASYLNVNFGIRFNKEIILYAVNPPLSMKIPYTMVQKLFGENSGLKPVELDIKGVLDGLAQGYDLKIKALSISNIPIDAFTLAKTKIVGSKNINDIYKDNYMNSPAILDTAHFILNGIETEISRTGRFRVREDQLPTLLSILESL